MTARSDIAAIIQAAAAAGSTGNALLLQLVQEKAMALLAALPEQIPGPGPSLEQVIEHAKRK